MSIKFAILTVSDRSSSGTREDRSGPLLQQAVIDSGWEVKHTDIVSDEFVGQFDIVMDIVYKPLITPLLKVAQSMEKTVITGDKMLLYQGVEAFRLWTEKDAPVEVMRGVLEKELF